MDDAPELRPPGWAFNPSNQSHRLRAAAPAAVGLVLSAICTLHTHGFVHELWEPLPVVTDAGWILPAVRAPAPVLDLVGFVAILVLSALGRNDRWRARPRVAIVLGCAAALTAMSAVLRWVLQFAVIGTTSTLFFLTVVSAVMTLLFLEEEIYAAMVHVHRSRLGFGADDLPYDSIEAEELRSPVRNWTDYAAGVGGVLVGAAVLLLANDLHTRAAVHERFLGGLIVAIGALSLSRIGRPLRWLNAAIGAWLLAAPLVYGYLVRGVLYSTTFGLLLLMVSVVFGSTGDAKPPGPPAARYRA